LNSKQRVLAALDHREPDRVPLGEWGIDHDTVERVLGHKTFHRSRRESTLAIWAGRAEEVHAGSSEDLVELILKLDHDLVPVGWIAAGDFKPATIKELGSDAWQDEEGRIYKYSSGNDAILCVDPGHSQPIDSKDALIEYCETRYFPDMGFKVSSWTDDGCELELADERGMDMAKYVVAALGSERFVFARSFAEFSLPLRGDQQHFFTTLLLNPELARFAFRMQTCLDLAIAREMIDAGVDAIMPGGDFSDSTGPMVSPRLIREIFLPGMKELAEYGKRRGKRVLSHNCGNNWQIMDILIEAGYEGYQSIQSKTAAMDLRRLKEEYGDRLALWGGINIETLHDGTVNEAKREVLDALLHAGPGGGLIIGSSNSVAYGAKFENYMAAQETAKSFGTYPIDMDKIAAASERLPSAQ